MARILLALLEATVDSVKSRSDQFRTDYTQVYGCVQGLLDFHFYASYPEHNDDSLDMMNHALRRLYENRKVFLKYQTDKRTKKAAAALHAERNEERDR
jgi:hypothetical protein